MLSVDASSETSTMQRMIALFRVRCDISEQDELLHFIDALHVSVLMIRPLWVIFEIRGIPSEVEGNYQSVLGYGVVDQLSFSRAFLSSGYESKRSTDETSREDGESGEQEASLTQTS
jgi:acetolactate synthase small subunit